MLYLMCYDITNTKRLKKVAKIMEEYGNREQKSVFEVYTTKEVIERIRNRVNKVIEKEDFVVYFELCNFDWQNKEKFGIINKNKNEDKDFYIKL